MDQNQEEQIKEVKSNTNALVVKKTSLRLKFNEKKEERIGLHIPGCLKERRVQVLSVQKLFFNYFGCQQNYV